MRTIIALLLLCLGAAANAATFGLHLASVHVPSRDYQRNVNPGLYVRLDSGITAGVYRNTLGRTTVYGGYTFEWGPFGLTLGAATGYQKHAVPVPCERAHYVGCTRIDGVSNAVLVPMVAPSVRLPEVAGLTPRLSIIPGLAGSANVLHLSVERSF